MPRPLYHRTGNAVLIYGEVASVPDFKITITKFFSLSAHRHKDDVNNATYEGQSVEMEPTICLSICLCAFYNLDSKNVL